MAWPFSGDWDGRNTQDLKEIMSALIVALNERRDAVDLDPIEFFYGDGTPEKADPTPAEFDGFPVNGDAMIANIESLQDEIAVLVGADGVLNGAVESATIRSKWAKSAANRTPWTLATLLADGSYGSSWLSTTGRQIADTTLWLQIQEAFDRLLWPVYWFTIQSWEFSRKLGETGGIPPDGDWEDAWDEAKADDWTTFTVQFEREFKSGWLMATTGNFFFANIYRNSVQNFITSNIRGSLLEGIQCFAVARAVVYGVNDPVTSPDIDISFTDGHNEITIPEGSSRAEEDQWWDLFSEPFDEIFKTTSGTWPNVGSNTPGQLEVSTAEPDDAPFTHMEFNSTHRVYAQLRIHEDLEFGNEDTEDDAMRAYTNITSLLTDQD